ncbi:hypothetical protein HPT25_04775 [Bacillus sp. BRMEA1]|uniref:hypothetical protein n=1 Tax=Neobacillus endophyticus TaxID=2738405 RepID=UPI00156305BB|nr:hypothetical protein [Neobacillus endophyticus]NRD76805.1 hypothetical protein [Neobacillus endophyticus]
MERISVTFEGEDYILLFRYESGFCEIVKEGSRLHHVKLVHLSEVILKSHPMI